MFAPRWASKFLGGTRPHAAGLLGPFALTHGGPGLRGNPVGVHRPCLTDWMPLDDQKASKNFQQLRGIGRILAVTNHLRSCLSMILFNLNM